MNEWMNDRGRYRAAKAAKKVILESFQICSTFPLKPVCKCISSYWFYAWFALLEISSLPFADFD